MAHKSLRGSSLGSGDTSDLEVSLVSSGTDVDTEPESPPPTGKNGDRMQRTPLLGRTRAPRRRLTSNTLGDMISETAHRDPVFSAILTMVEHAIDANVQPELIKQGSSGSYFAKNPDRRTVAVFKPKNEEPYGEFNPKWTKYIQRICCPCMFGRPCLVLNQGYLSEAGAYVVDQFFRLNVVPMTKVVQLSSPSFYYSKVTRLADQAIRNASGKFPDIIGKRVRQGLPLKTGSMQIFVNGYKDASQWLKKWNWDALSEEFKVSFQHQFESLVVLDYLIRNTDRGMDNWLIRCEVGEAGEQAPTSVQVAAIDNGLAFPHKHPDDWRTYPYHWAYLSQAKQPFSDRTAEKLLPFLCDDNKVEELVRQLRDLFTLDSGFRNSVFNKQMSVLRGQIVNLREALRMRKSPHQLVRMPNASVLIHKFGPNKSERNYRQIVAKRLPFFRDW